MAIEIVPHSEQLSGAVDAFNQRMRAAGSEWGFYENPTPDWIPRRPGQSVWREYHLAVENGERVIGGYALKPQQWLIDGEPHWVTDWQGPFSEGAISRKYNTLGLRMMRDMLKKWPLLYSWGHGADDEPMIQMLRKMGWLMHPTPFCLRVCRPYRFLRLNRYLRPNAARRAALDALAFSGLGAIGLLGLHAALRARSRKRFSASAERFDRFGAWADDLWERAQGEYAAIAVRDAGTMNALIPDGGWPPCTCLRVERAGEPVGWAAVLDTTMEDDARFGRMRVGSIVDCLARPADAGEVVSAAWHHLRERGVDLVISNQAHPDWIRAMIDNGFVAVPGRRIFAASPALAAALDPFSRVSSGLHLTNMDGHGPMGL